MQSKAETVEEYLASLPPDRREAVSALRAVILAYLPKGYKEGMQYGMIGYYIPLETFPNTYNKQPLAYAALASQKNYIALYLMSVYSGNEAWFRDAYQKTGKKLDMGKSCIRFKHIDDLALDVIGDAVALYTPEAFIAAYKHSRDRSSGVVS